MFSDLFCEKSYLVLVQPHHPRPFSSTTPAHQAPSLSAFCASDLSSTATQQVIDQSELSPIYIAAYMPHSSEVQLLLLVLVASRYTRISGSTIHMMCMSILILILVCIKIAENSYDIAAAAVLLLHDVLLATSDATSALVQRIRWCLSSISAKHIG